MNLKTAMPKGEITIIKLGETKKKRSLLVLNVDEEGRIQDCTYLISTLPLNWDLKRGGIFWEHSLSELVTYLGECIHDDAKAFKGQYLP